MEATPPLPPERPRDHVGEPRVPASGSPPPEPVPPPAPVPPKPSTPNGPAAPQIDLACTRLFASGTVLAKALPTVATTPEGCGMAAPVLVSGVVVSPTRTIAFEPAVTMDCTLAATVAEWVRGDLAAIFVSPAPALVALTDTSGYACRSRNHIAGAKLSEHGHGNAMDIGGLKTADGTVVSVKQAGSPVLVRVKATACARFNTVLGPGSDGFHENHLHVDLAPRRPGSNICHWDL